MVFPPMLACLLTFSLPRLLMKSSNVLSEAAGFCSATKERSGFAEPGGLATKLLGNRRVQVSEGGSGAEVSRRSDCVLLSGGETLSAGRTPEL
jgi:hypothetical protein